MTSVPDRELQLHESLDEISRFVLERRKAHAMSQRDLAQLAGVGVRLVSEVERAKPTLRMDGVTAILAVFGKRLGVVESKRPETLDDL